MNQLVLFLFDGQQKGWTWKGIYRPLYPTKRERT